MRDGFNIGTFTLCLCACGSPALDGFESLLQLRLGLQTGGKGIAPTTQCDTPVGDCARGIVGKDGIESFNGARKLERMHKSYGAIELRLRCLTARGAEGHSAQMLRDSVLVVGLGAS